MSTSLVFRAASLAASLLIGAAAQSAVRATVDSTAVDTDSTLELVLEHDGQTTAQPDLSALKQEFDILSTSGSSNVRIVNGSVSSSARVSISLSPKHRGQLRIPAIAWGNEKSEPIVINVGASQGNPRASNSAPASGKVFLKTTIEPQQAYVQAEVDLTVRLYSAAPLYHAQLEVPPNNEVLVQQVGADRQESATENGQRYQVIERHYKLFPQRSGSLTLSGPVLEAQIAVQDRMDPFGSSFKDIFGNSPFSAFATTKPLRLHGDDITLNVLPRPAAAGSQAWLPARDVTLHGEWRPAQGAIKAGDPVTLDLHLRARGLTAAQLPDLNALLKLPPGLKAYPDQAKLTNDTQEGNVVGERDQSIALIAEHAGEFAIPALSVQWWDTQGNKIREATLPARTLSFAPGAISAPNAAQPQSEETRAPPVAAATPTRDSGSGSTWAWVSIALATLWAITLMAWYLSGRRPPKLRAANEDKVDSTAAEARRRVADACRRSDARAARSSLLEWIGTSNVGRRPISLRAFAQNANQADLTQLLEELDRACYAGGAWEGRALLQSLNQLPTSVPSHPTPKAKLQPLYK